MSSGPWGWCQTLSRSVDSLLQTFCNESQPLGLHILVATHDSVVYNQYVGCNIPQAPNPARGLYDIGSVTKTLTALAVHELALAGKINLGDPLQRYLPEFNFPSIRIDHLLAHTSGLPELLKADRKTYKRLKSGKDRSFLDYFLSKKVKLQFQPGTRSDYSNTNYMLLAELIARTTGQQYEQYMTGFLHRAGCRDFVLMNSRSALPENAAKGYVQYRKKWVNSDTVNDVKRILRRFPGAGNIYMSPDSYLQFLRYVMARAGQVEALEQRLYRPYTGPDSTVNFTFAQGFEIARTDALGFVPFHEGYMPGFNSFVIFIPAKKDIVLLFSNYDLDNTDYTLRRIGNRIIGLMR